MKTLIHSSAFIDHDVKIGEGTKIWHSVHIMSGSVIGERCVLGQNVFVGHDVWIGDKTHIQNNVSVFHGVTLEDEVFVGPSATFTNVLLPRSGFPAIAKDYKPTIVREGASIGANATIVCGNIIGQYAMIGAGAVIIRDVPNNNVMCGNPAALKGLACNCGQILLHTNMQNMEQKELLCHSCGRRYSAEITVDVSLLSSS